jgi:hypothetical protein
LEKDRERPQRHREQPVQRQRSATSVHAWGTVELKEQEEVGREKGDRPEHGDLRCPPKGPAEGWCWSVMVRLLGDLGEVFDNQVCHRRVQGTHAFHVGN